MPGSLNPFNPAFSGLSNIHSGQRLQRNAPIVPRFGEFVRDEAHQDAFAYVERAEKKAQAAQVMHERRPHWDYMLHNYTTVEARSFADDYFELRSGTIQGREFLEALMTPKTISPLEVPDRDRLTSADYAAAGIPESRLREWADEKNLAFPEVYQLLKLAQRQGLVYELYDDNSKVTYYGIPPVVRHDLNLKTPEIQETGPATGDMGSVEDRRQFQQQLAGLFGQTAALADPADRTTRELMEYVTLIGEAAAEAGLIQPDEIPAAFGEFRGLFVDEKLDNGLLTLYEFCQDADILKPPVTELCKTAVKLGIVDPEEFREIAESYGDHPLLDLNA